VPEYEGALRRDFRFARWVRTNVTPHKRPGYAIVTLSLKPTGGIPGDASADDDRIDAFAYLPQVLDNTRTAAKQFKPSFAQKAA
jgi:sulfite reductase (NADPH) hemoprotein beta-component